MAFAVIIFFSAVRFQRVSLTSLRLGESWEAANQLVNWQAETSLNGLNAFYGAQAHFSIVVGVST